MAIKRQPCPVASAWWPLTVCVYLLVCVHCSPGSLRPPCIMVLHGPCQRGDGAGLCLSLPHPQLQTGWLFLRKGPSGFLEFPVASSLPAFFPLRPPLFFQEEEQRFGSRGGTDPEGMGFEGMGFSVTLPSQASLGQAGQWHGWASGSFPACLPSVLFSPRSVCFSRGKRWDSFSLHGGITGSRSRGPGELLRKGDLAP